MTTNKELQELALAYARKLQSAQTGYLHYFYNGTQQHHETIPLVENALFALGLFQSLNANNIVEARGLLDGILNFQLPDGNFPLYLHDYPHAQNRYVAIAILPALFWIYKLHRRFINPEGREKLVDALKKVVRYLLSLHAEKPAPYHFHVKLAAELKAIGAELGDQATEQQGTEMLNDLCTPTHSWYWPEQLGELIIAMQMAYTDPLQTAWKPFWEHLAQTWHQSSAGYIGPSFRDLQEGKEPQPALYDLFMGSFNGNFSKRALQPHIRLLHAFLIQPNQFELPTISYPFTHKGRGKQHSWQLNQTPSHACSAILHKEKIDPSIGTYLHPFRLIWGDLNHLHSLCASTSNAQEFACEFKENGADLLFTLDSPSTRKDAEQEIAFYINFSNEMKITVDGSPSTTFQMGEQIMITTKEIDLQIDFSIVEGSGRFFGHIFPANRPSQANRDKDAIFTAFDREIALRTILRSTPCLVKAQLRWQIKTA